MRLKRTAIERFMKLPIPKWGATHAQIAKELGLSKQRVQQIEQEALKKLAANAKRLQILQELLESIGDERSAFY